MKYIVLIIAFFLCAGCASARLERTLVDGSKVVIEYDAIGARAFKDVEIDPDTGLVKIGSSKGDEGELVELINNLLKMAAKGAMVP